MPECGDIIGQRIIDIPVHTIISDICQRTGPIKCNLFSIFRWSPVSFLAFDACQIDAGKDHGKIDGRNFHSGDIFGWFGQPESALFQPFVPEGIAIAVPVEKFDSVGAFVGKDEKVARERIFEHDVFSDGGETVVAFAKIHRTGGDEDFKRAWNA